jgi:hypothetical protein
LGLQGALLGIKQLPVNQPPQNGTERLRNVCAGFII